MAKGGMMNKRVIEDYGMKNIVMSDDEKGEGTRQ